MVRIFSSLVGIAAAAVALLGTAEAYGSAVDYDGQLCTDFVNYKVWLPPGRTVQLVEQGLAAMGLSKNATDQIPFACYDSFMKYACSSAFPMAEATANPLIYNVRFTCKSTCQKAVNDCQFTLGIVKPDAIPNCDGPIPGSITPEIPAGVAFQPNEPCLAGTCLKPQGADQKCLPAVGGDGLRIKCPEPYFKEDQRLIKEGVPTSEQYCKNGCCLQCPAQYALYKDGALDIGFKVTDYTRAVSTVFSFLLMISYLCLPEKRSHPSALILFFSICVFLFSVVIIFPLTDRYGMQCSADGVNPSTQFNNLRCAIQGGILIFASVGTAAWCTAVIVNLHLHTVWNSAWMARKYWLLHILCWGAAAAICGTALGLGEVKWEYATLCLISQHRASDIFFYPMAAMIFPAFLLHIATFIHIARISTQAGVDSETMSRSTLSAGAAAVISHRRHVMMAIKVQWRAALMAIWALVTVTFYWLFYFVQLRKIDPRDLELHIWEFVACLSKGTAHDTCVETMKDVVPPYVLMIAAEFAVSTIGTVIFLVFFKAALWEEWKEWFANVSYFLRGRRTQQKEQEQFFVI
ncbi:hypothetical protein DFQ26_008154 [Actinomortierella ambigua]|nr:hypothetical protein DFQ26_008154 [Actinomortierella ambigua]